MFPTRGYFQYITCPGYKENTCRRKYCHYRHKKDEAPFETWIKDGAINMSRIHTADELSDETDRLLETDNNSRIMFAVLESGTIRKTKGLTDLLRNDADPLGGIMDLARIDPDYERDISSLQAPQINIGDQNTDNDDSYTANDANENLLPFTTGQRDGISGLFSSTFTTRQREEKIPGLLSPTEEERDSPNDEDDIPSDVCNLKIKSEMENDSDSDREPDFEMLESPFMSSSRQALDSSDNLHECKTDVQNLQVVNYKTEVMDFNATSSASAPPEAEQRPIVGGIRVRDDIARTNGQEENPVTRAAESVIKSFLPNLWDQMNDYMSSASSIDSLENLSSLNRMFLLKYWERLDEISMTVSELVNCHSSPVDFNFDNTDVSTCPHLVTCKSCFNACFRKRFWDVKTANKAISVDITCCTQQHQQDAGSVTAATRSDHHLVNNKNINISSEFETKKQINIFTSDDGIEVMAEKSESNLNNNTTIGRTHKADGVVKKPSTTLKPPSSSTSSRSIKSEKSNAAKTRTDSGSDLSSDEWDGDFFNDDNVSQEPSTRKRAAKDTNDAKKKRISHVKNASQLTTKQVFPKRRNIPNPKEAMLSRYNEKNSTTAGSIETTGAGGGGDTSSIKLNGGTTSKSTHSNWTGINVGASTSANAGRIRINPVQNAYELYNPVIAKKQSEEAIKRNLLLKEKQSLAKRVVGRDPKPIKHGNVDGTAQQKQFNIGVKRKCTDLGENDEEAARKHRVAHLPRNIDEKKPGNRLRGPEVSTYKPNNNIQKEVRQQCLNRFYAILLKKLPPDAASRKATEQEQIVHEKVTQEQTYKKSSAITALNISKLSASELLKTQADSDYPVEINGISTYDLLARYLLTDDEFDLNGYPSLREDCTSVAKIAPCAIYYKPLSARKKGENWICLLCKQDFEIDTETGYAIMNGTKCIFHRGRLSKKLGDVDKIYSCCGSTEGQSGCENGTYHIPDRIDDDYLEGFVETKEPPETMEATRQFYALDCEMCYTTIGIELTRVTVIDQKTDVVYESFVKPLNPILDHSTKYSGVTASMLENVTKTVADVQRDLLKFIYNTTILIGHSLENDLKALKIVHRNVVDTSVMYPHKYAPRIKWGLKQLAEKHISMLIQEGETGHDSKEDAVASLRLVWNKLRSDGHTYRPREVIGM